MISQQLIDKMLSGDLAAWQDYNQLIIQEALRAIPLANDFLMKQSAVLHDKSTKFYKENSDLLEHKPLVAQAIEVLEAQNPGADFDTILKKAAENVRKTTQMPQLPNKTFSRRVDQIDDVIGKL